MPRYKTSVPWPQISVDPPVPLDATGQAGQKKAMPTKADAVVQPGAQSQNALSRTPGPHQNPNNVQGCPTDSLPIHVILWSKRVPDHEYDC